ncbi:hypothetical protein [Rhodococcus jostii]|uniref:hypothetical protein n=1 Tax=Rhodococcus jostii TaxID=132919 RepID=UPI003633DDCA
MTTSTKKSRLHRMRKLAYAPLVAAVAAGAICTGAGTSAATDTTAPAATDTPQSGNAYDWYLLNHTGQPIYGTWSAEMSTGDHSRVETDADRPWKADDAAKAVQYKNWSLYTTWTGHICYNKHWWDYQDRHLDWVLEDHHLVFTLEADSTGALFMYPDFNKRSTYVALTPEDGGC